MKNEAIQNPSPTSSRSSRGTRRSILHDRVNSAEWQRSATTEGRSGRTHVRSPVQDGRLSPRDGSRDGEVERLIPTASRVEQPEPDHANAGEHGLAAQLLGRAAGSWLHTALWTFLNAIRLFRIPPNHEHPAQTTIGSTGEPTLHQQSLTPKTLFFQQAANPGNEVKARREFQGENSGEVMEFESATL